MTDPSTWLARHAHAVAAAYDRSGAGRWRVSRAAFDAAVARALAHRFGDREPDGKTAASFIASLQADEIALACACIDGNEEAWDHFVVTYRPELYRAARAVAGDADSRELADSLHAELYGLPAADGTRRSLLAYYHGRSKLTTWLRSVLAQRYVDRVRARRRVVSLDDPEHSIAEPAARTTSPDPDAQRRAAAVSASIGEALASLDTADRLRVSYYYAQQLTLAEIGRLMHEHEATVSRKLEKARRRLKSAIEAALRARGVDPRDVDDWGRAARVDWTGGLDDLAPCENQAPQDAPRAPFKEESTP